MSGLLQRLKGLFHRPTANELLLSKGVSVIAKVHADMTAGGYAYWADGGTLLGFVREHGFIRHDFDVDFIVPGETSPQELLKYLLARGYRFEHAFVYRETITELTFSLEGLSIDFFWQYDQPDGFSHMYVYKRLPDVDYPHRAKSVQRIRRPAPTKIIDWSVLGVVSRVPENYAAILEANYGPTWMSPVAHWSPPPDDPNRTIVEGFGTKLSNPEQVFRMPPKGGVR